MVVVTKTFLEVLEVCIYIYVYTYVCIYVHKLYIGLFLYNSKANMLNVCTYYHKGDKEGILFPS